MNGWDVGESMRTTLFIVTSLSGGRKYGRGNSWRNTCDDSILRACLENEWIVWLIGRWLDVCVWLNAHVVGWVCTWLDIYMDGWMDLEVNMWMVEWLFGWIYGWLGGYLDEYVDGWIDTWIVGWMDLEVNMWMVNGYLGKYVDSWMDIWVNMWMAGWMIVCESFYGWLDGYWKILDCYISQSNI